jgi:alpha-tubulin suppressor-like RCC1 family protein
VTRARACSLLVVVSFFSVIEGCDALFGIDDHGLLQPPPDAATEGGSAPKDGGGASQGATAADTATADAPTADTATGDTATGDREAGGRDATLPSSDAEAPVRDAGGVDSTPTGDSGGVSCATNHGGCNAALPCVPTGTGTALCLKVTQLASGDAFNCARLSDGTLRCWGLNQIYELGAASPAMSPTPLTIANGAGVALSDVVEVAAGAFFACARDSQGVVQCWGDDTSGALGDRNETSTPTPVTVQIPGPATDVGSGHLHNCASLTSGAVECWGGNPQGQLGDGTTTDNLTPVTAIASGATAVAAGDYNTCAIVSGGFVQCWGSNMYGEIGDGTTIDRPTPTTALVAGATAVAVGSGHTCALVAGGAVQCWGRNDTGQLGDGTTTQRSMPITAIGANAVSLAVSSFDYNPAHTCAVLASGAVECWGSNAFGQLGDGTTTDRYAPETVIASGAAAVTCGTRHTCALMLDGTVRCWGDDEYGATAGSSPTTPVSIPQ